MSYVSIPMIYSKQHTLHSPPVEFVHGALLPYQESPARAENIARHLTASGLVTLHEVEEIVDRALLEKVHSPGMLDYLARTADEAKARIRQDFASYHRLDLAEQHDYVYPVAFPSSAQAMSANWRGAHGFYAFDQTAPIGSGTWTAVLESASVAYSAAKRVAEGGDRLNYALCRPPGHHAGRDFIGGYCYVNNAALAAETLLSLGRVAIVDVDYHHGNGTQAIFWNRPDVFFCSIHAHPDVEYPYYSGFAEETGGADAPNTTTNAPLALGVSPEVYLSALDELLEKVRAFQPAALVVSLGFDTYKADPIGSFMLDVPHYHAMAGQIAALDLPMVIVQEGGYRAEALGLLAEAFLRGALRLPLQP